MKRFISTRTVYQWDDKSQSFLLEEKEGYWYDGPMSLAMDTPTIDQFSIQLFNDDGTDETDSTSKAGVGVDIVDQALDENILVRFLVKETAGNASANYAPQVQIRHNGGTYENITGTASIGRPSDSTKLTDGNDCTQRIGSGTFVTANKGQDDVNGSAGGSGASFVGNDEMEFVFCFQIRSVTVSAGDNVELRIADVDVDNYTDPEIKITIASSPPTASGTPSIDEITASGISTQTYKASGTASIAEVTASGISTIIKKATGAVVVTAVVASGVAALVGALTSDGTPSTEEIEASGQSTQIYKPSGTPSIEEITASGVSKIIKKADGTPSIAEITAVGVATLVGDVLTASGTPVLEEIEASGVSVQTLKPSGTPSINEILAAGISTILKRGSGNPSIEEILALGVVDQIQKPSGTPSIEEVTASGVSRIIKKSSGAVTLPEVEAFGLAGLAGILTASGNPSIEEITAVGIVIQTQKASGALSTKEITASGVSTVITPPKLASGTPSIAAIEASGVSALNVIPPTIAPTPTTNYSGKVALDLARPGDIRDPATDRAIAFLHDAVEQLSLSETTKHDELGDITPDQHHAQEHKLYSSDHIDVDITEILVTGSVLTFVRAADGGENTFKALNSFVARGYGGIEQTGTPGLSDLDGSFQVLPANAGLITSPIGVIQDHANNGIELDISGIWSVGINIELTHDEDNGGRETQVQIWNATHSTESRVILVPIARNQPGTLLSLTFMVEVPIEDVEDLFQIRIGNGDTVGSIVLNAYQFSVNHISEFMG